MSSESQHFQSLSITILAIATAAIGFGLFGADFRPVGNLATRGFAGFLAAAKLLSGGLAFVQYLAVLVSVARILMQHGEVSGRQVTLGPLVLMGGEMALVAAIFIIGVFEQQIDG